MPGFNPENINIHDLIIEEPEKEREVYFDPKKDITELTRQLMHKDFNESLAHHADSFCGLIARMHILGENLEIPDEVLGELYTQLYTQKALECEKGPDLGAFTIHGAEMKIAGYDVKVEQEYLDLVSTFKWDPSNKWRLNTDFSHAANLAILGAKFSIPGEAWKARVAYIKSLRQVDGGWKSLVAANVENRILGGTADMTDDEWEKLREEYQNYHHHFGKDKQGFGYGVASSGAQLMILSANKVSVPPGGGLEVVWRGEESLQSQNPEMPEKRKF